MARRIPIEFSLLNRRHFQQLLRLKQPPKPKVVNSVEVRLSHCLRRGSHQHAEPAGPVLQMAFGIVDDTIKISNAGAITTPLSPGSVPRTPKARSVV